MKKHIIAATLAACLAVSPALAVFPDVTDPAVSEAVEVLRQLEVVNGKPDGTFAPQGTFTRGEFCKMALTILGRAEERQLYAGRVIFSDVTASHWALGWINAAAAVKEGTTPLVRGRGDGRFCPDDAITAGEAVTILLRCLGYSDKDVGGDGGAWYAGAMARAKSIELLEGLEALNGEDTLTRAQAALLFENLLYTQSKDSTDIFLTSVLGGAVDKSQLVLEVKGKALSAGGWAVTTDKGSFVTFRDDLDAGLQGRMCKPVTDREGNVLALQADEDYTVRSVRIRSAEARYVLTEDGAQLLVSADVPVWHSDKDQESYANAYKSIVPGATALFCYDKTDTLISIYFTGDSATAVTAVAKDASHPFDGAWEGNPTAVYKNGLKASLSDVKPYDVGIYDSRTGVLELSDKKLTGVYENAVPSPVSPDTITVMGCDGLVVLDCALGDLAKFKLGDRVTLLLDRSNRVAGVVGADKVSKKALGTASITKGGKDSYGDVYTATVNTADGLTLKGRVRSSDQGVTAAPGKLWEVTSTQLGWLELTTASSAAVTGDWNVTAMTLGGARVSPWAAVYDKIEGGHMVKVGMDAVTLSTVPSASIALVHLDSNGAVDALALRDVTGDGYTYGVTDYVQGSYTSSEFGMGTSTPSTLTLTNGAGDTRLVTGVNFGAKGMEYVGVAPALFSRSGDPTLANWVTLTAHSGVHRTAFGDDTVRVGGVDWPLAADIDSCCYNAKSETWFKSLDACLSYSSTLTVYCDRSPSEGGKVRLVVVE